MLGLFLDNNFGDCAGLCVCVCACVFTPLHLIKQTLYCSHKTGVAAAVARRANALIEYEAKVLCPLARDRRRYSTFT